MSDSEHPTPQGVKAVAPLRSPLALELHDPVSEAQVLRIWRRVATRRAAPRAPARSVLIWALAGAAMGVAAMVAIETVRGPGQREVPAEVARAPGPLVLRGGGAIEVVEVAVGAPSRAVELSDGSRLEVDVGARVEPLASSRADVVLRLARGRVVFDVAPGGPRRWVIEAGIASIEVVGTRFSVERASDHVQVDVERGVVLVRGATITDGVARVEAGMSLDVRAATVATVTPGDAGDAQSHKRHSEPDGAWRARAAHGQYAEAYVALGSGGVGRETARAASADDLLALADVARLSGHPAEAVDPLERILREHASSPSAPLSALTLGRIQLALGRPSEAARALERALALRVPAGLEEDLYARLVEAYAKAGDRPAAAAAAREYRRRFPSGRRAADVLRWAAE